MYRIVLTTAGTHEEAEKIAKVLVDAKIAACVNIIPQVTSIYRWQGKIESASELLLIVKTVAEHTESVRRKILEVHSYDVPECIVLDVAGGSEPYLAWITESTR